LSVELRLGGRGPRRRAQGRARGEGRPAPHRPDRENGSGQALRCLGDELAGVQLRGRSEAATIGGRTGRVLHVSPGRDRREPARQPGSRQLPVHDDRSRAERLISSPAARYAGYATEIRGAVVTSPTSQQTSPRCSKPSRTAATFSTATAKRRPPEVSDSNSRLTSASGSAGSIAS